MIFNETFDFLFNQLAGANDAGATTRLLDYQRKRLRRALLSRSIRPYTLEASWLNSASGAVGETFTANTQAVTKPLIVLDGAIRTANPTFVGGRSAQLGTQEDFNNFEIQMIRSGGDSRVQVTIGKIKDEHLLCPSQAAVRQYVPFAGGIGTRLGQGAMYPLTWPVPLRLMPNELLQVRSTILLGNVPASRTTFCQFRCVSVDNEAEDDNFIADLRQYIKDHPKQRPYFLSMYSDNARSIAFPATGTLQRTTAKTIEAPEHLLVLGYSALFARSKGLLDGGGLNVASGTTCSPKWRLESSNGYAFSREEIDIATYAYAGPGLFWNEFAHPFLLPKGCSLSANFSTLSAIQNAQEQIDNFIIFRCVTV